MRISITPARELTPGQLEQWETWRTGRAEWSNPFFSAAFLQQVAAERADCRVAWWEEDNGRAVAALAFHRQAPGVGRPLGLHLCDYQGVLGARVAAPTGEWLRALGLELMDFDHLLPGSFADESGLAPNRSPLIEVDAGYEALTQKLRARGGAWDRVQRSRRRLERELGPLRFEWDTRDERVWRALWEWKRGQYAATGVRDPLRPAWVQGVLARLRTLDQPGCAGVCSALWSGDALVAAHFGLRSRGVLHWWFPAYAPEHSRYGAGLVLLDELLRALAARGDRHLDLGKGDEPYKEQWATGAQALLEGSLTRGGVVTASRAVGRRCRAWLRASPVGGVVRWLRHVRKR